MSTGRSVRLWLIAMTFAVLAAGCSDEETSVSVGRPTVVTQVELQAGENRFYVSSNGGASWKQSEGPRLEPFTDGGLGAGNPKNIRTELDQVSKGTIYYLFHAQDPTAGGARSVLLGRSTDGGLTWRTSPVDVAPKGTEEATELNWQAHMAIDPANEQRIYVTWRRAFQVPMGAPQRPVRPFVAVSEDGGATFGSPTMLMDKSAGFEAPRLAIRDGKMFAFYRLNAPAAGPGVPEPRLTSIVASISEDGGKTWKDSEITAQRDASEPVSLFDAERGTFYLVWHDNRNQDLDVFFSKSTDAVTWSEPRQLNDDPKGTRIGQFYPKIAVAPGGRIDVAWYDFRDDPFPAPTVAPTATAPFLGLTTDVGKFDAVYMTSSEDEGQTWSKNIKANDVPNDRTLGTAGPQFFVQVPLAVASGDDWSVVAWSDTRNGNLDNSTQDIATNVVDHAFTEPGGYRSRDVAFGILGGVVFGAGLAMLLSVMGMRRSARGAATTATA